MKTPTFWSWKGSTSSVSDWTMPITRPPANAPGIDPRPPSTTATNISTMKLTATVGSIG